MKSIGSSGNAPEPYDFEDKDIDPLIGAQLLGYRLIRLHPKNASFPMHFHHFSEEMFYVMEGRVYAQNPTRRSDNYSRGILSPFRRESRVPTK